MGYNEGKSNRLIAQTNKQRKTNIIFGRSNLVTSRADKMFVRQGNYVYAGMRLIRSVTLILCHVIPAQSYCVKRTTTS